MAKTQSRRVAESQGGKSQTQSRKEWTTGTWKGLPRWQCELCPWDTLEGEEAMLEHMRTVHAPPPPRKVALPLVDAKGKQIVVEKEDGAD